MNIIKKLGIGKVYSIQNRIIDLFRNNTSIISKLLKNKQFIKKFQSHPNIFHLKIRIYLEQNILQAEKPICRVGLLPRNPFEHSAQINGPRGTMGLALYCRPIHARKIIYTHYFAYALYNTQRTRRPRLCDVNLPPTLPSFCNGDPYRSVPSVHPGPGPEDQSLRPRGLWDLCKIIGVCV